jgi:hypothetical protein
MGRLIICGKRLNHVSSAFCLQLKDIEVTASPEPIRSGSAWLAQTAKASTIALASGVADAAKLPAMVESVAGL